MNANRRRKRFAHLKAKYDKLKGNVQAQLDFYMKVNEALRKQDYATRKQWHEDINTMENRIRILELDRDRLQSNSVDSITRLNDALNQKKFELEEAAEERKQAEELWHMERTVLLKEMQRAIDVKNDVLKIYGIEDKDNILVSSRFRK